MNDEIGRKELQRKKDNDALATRMEAGITKDRGAWEKELQRHCAEVYVDPEETIDEQQKRNMMFREDK